jgi:hypothetical protein
MLTHPRIPVLPGHVQSVAAARGLRRDTPPLIEDIRAVITATGHSIVPTGAAMLGAFRGREAEARELIEATTSDVMRRGQGLGLSSTRWATAVLYNGLGR